MAKVGISIETTISRRIQALAFRRINQKDFVSVRLQSRIDARMEALATSHRAEMRAALVSWRALSSWKRTRWSMCATITRYPADIDKPRRFQNGFNLYYRCWKSQGIVSPKEPISPCSRRMTEPTASPWDYTP